MLHIRPLTLQRVVLILWYFTYAGIVVERTWTQEHSSEYLLPVRIFNMIDLNKQNEK